MPSKRFLGLGFTFSATDRGLEKKLKSVHNQLRGISTSLGSIKQNGTSAQKALRNVGTGKAPRQQQQGGRRPSVQTRKQPGAPVSQGPAPQPNPVQPPNTNSKLKRRLLEKELFEVGKRVHSKVFDYNSDRTKEFLNKIQDLPVQLNQSGKIALSDYKRLVKLAGLYQKQAKLVEKSVKRAQILLFFTEDIPNWLRKIKGSFFGFLDTLGLRLDNIIPEPFKALFVLVKDVMSLPMRMMSKLVGLDKLTDKIKDFFFGASEQKQVKIAIDDLKNEIGGTQTGSSNSLLKKILEAVSGQKTPQKESSGFMAGILGFLKPKLGAIVGLFSSLLGGIVGSGTFGKIVKGFISLANSPIGVIAFKLLKFAGALTIGITAVTTFWEVFSEKGFSLASVFEALWKTFDNLLLNAPSWLLKKSKLIPEDGDPGQKTIFDATKGRPIQPMQSPVVPPQVMPSQASATQQSEILQEQLSEARRSNDLMQEMVQLLASSQSGSEKDRAFADIFSRMSTAKKGFATSNFAAGDETPL